MARFKIVLKLRVTENDDFEIFISLMLVVQSSPPPLLVHTHTRNISNTFDHLLGEQSSEKSASSSPKTAHSRMPKWPADRSEFKIDLSLFFFRFTVENRNRTQNTSFSHRLRRLHVLAESVAKTFRIRIIYL